MAIASKRKCGLVFDSHAEVVVSWPICFGVNNLKVFSRYVVTVDC